MAEKTPYLIVIGFGIPGRTVVDDAIKNGIDYLVIEANAATVKRSINCWKIMQGDACDPNVLKQAQIERATHIVVAVPHQETALQVTRLARHLNESAIIVMRCHYISVRFEAKAAGANYVIVAEEVVAKEMSAVVSPLFNKSPT